MTKSDPSATRKRSKSGELDNGEVNFTDDPLSEKIGNSLRSMYDEVAKEPVPDAFLALLAKADEKQ